MMKELSDRRILLAAVDGDLDAFEELVQRPPDRIEAQANSLPGLMVTKEAVARILEAMQQGASQSVVQQWASFVRRGYFAQAKGSSHPIEIEYETSAEDRIADIVARLDELGDLIDGVISDDELAEMLSDMTHLG
jgi:hypothetical protein